MVDLITIRGRGSADNPPNRFEKLAYEPDPESRDPEEPDPRTVYYRDTSRSVLTSNDSPDVGFEHSVNPYRGCENGCIYCFARPTHEWLGLSAGLDFETKIFVKEDAPELLRQALASKRWTPKPVAMSGVTDPYQAIETKLRITRRCLEVLNDFRNPVLLITKRAMIARDVDLFAEMAARDGVKAHLSITTLDPALQRVMEPRASTPAKRLEAVRTLADAGVPVGVLVAPVIPGLTDHELPAILEASAEAGAASAGFIPLRLPFGVKELFEQWLETHFPDRKEKVLNRIREMRGGKLNDPNFHSRMHGEGQYVAQIGALFEVTARKFGLNKRDLTLSTAHFRRLGQGGQLGLFE